MSSSNNKINSVFYAESYHPIQAGSIDGTDILPHDNAVYRAHLCSTAGLYDPFGDPKVIGDPYCTLFVGRLSDLTDEDSLRKAMSKYGRVKSLRLVRHIVTGASRGYAFVEYETDREMLRAHEDAHHSIIDGNEIIVDYNRQQLMPGWIPRRLGGGLGGKKESGQLRFGGRERPFRAPLRPIPYEDLKRLGIPPPPEGKYMPRFKIPSPPRRRSSHTSREESRHGTPEDRSSSRTNREGSPSTSRHRRYENRGSRTIREDSPSNAGHRRSEDRRSTHTIRANSRSPSRHRKSERQRSSYISTDDSSSKYRRSEGREHRPKHWRTPSERDEPSHNQDRHHREHSHQDYKERSSTREYSPHRHKKRSTIREYSP